MFIKEETLDDLLIKVFKKLLKSKNSVYASRGPNKEILGALLELKNPRARLSRSEVKGTIFSCLGELLWYLSRSNKVDFIDYYISGYDENSEDGKIVHGAYGPRLFNMDGKINQLDNVIDLLGKKKSSRRAVIQLFDGNDLVSHYKDIPCTCTLQFLIRDNRLHMFVSMRSNDAFLGLPHDVFSFTMIQEIIARKIGVEIGAYQHAVASLHLYSEHIVKAQNFIDEGYQSTLSMPSMPIGNPWPSIEELLKKESGIRTNSDYQYLESNKYWTDIGVLLEIFALSKLNTSDSISKVEELKKQINSDIYKIYIDKRRERMKSKVVQGKLPFSDQTGL